MTGLTYKRNGITLGDLTYGYDAAGRRTSMGGSYARVNLPPALTSATYDAANKLTNWAGTAPTYDLNGNLTGDGTRTYTWDTRDRLTATSGGGQTSSYVYDAFGRRISRTISGAQTAYVHDGHNPVHTGTGSTITGTLLNGGGLDERYVRTVGGANSSLLTDALGSLLHIVNAAGTTTATYTYEPYGAVTSSGTDSTGFQYTGREVDVGGLMYYRARYYNPRTARFLSEDPIGLAGGVNLYGYVGGGPTNAVDPTGEIHPAIAGALVAFAYVGYTYGPVVYNLIQAMRKADETSTQAYGGAAEMVKNGNPSPADANQVVEAYRQYPRDIGEVVKQGAELQKKFHEKRAPKKETPPYERVPEPKATRCAPGTCCLR